MSVLQVVPLTILLGRWSVLQKVKVAQSCPTLCDPMDYPWNSPGQNTGVCSLSLLQGIFPTQGLNPGLSCCRQILYTLSNQGSPGVLQWVAYPFSSGSSQPRSQTGVSCIAGGFFTSWATGKLKNAGAGSLSLLQWIFPTQESNQGLLHCRWILYQLSYQGSPFYRCQNQSLLAR